MEEATTDEMEVAAQENEEGKEKESCTNSLMEVLYFKFSDDRATTYMAAESETSLRLHLKISVITVGKLEEIAIAEAVKAPHFNDFAKKFNLCPDGTFSLGVIRDTDL